MKIKRVYVKPVLPLVAPIYRFAWFDDLHFYLGIFQVGVN